MIFFTNIQGLAAHLLGADPQVNAAGMATDKLLPEMGDGGQAALLVRYIASVGKTLPWAVGILAVCAIAALQSTAATFLSTTGGVLARDIYKHYLNRDADHLTQKLAARISASLILLVALLLATYSMDAVVLLGGLALACSFQLWPSLLAVTWFPWITRQAATLGLIAGLIAVVLTESR